MLYFLAQKSAQYYPALLHFLARESVVLYSLVLDFLAQKSAGYYPALLHLLLLYFLLLHFLLLHFLLLHFLLLHFLLLHFLALYSLARELAGQFAVLSSCLYHLVLYSLARESAEGTAALFSPLYFLALQSAGYFVVKLAEEGFLAFELLAFELAFELRCHNQYRSPHFPTLATTLAMVFPIQSRAIAYHSICFPRNRNAGERCYRSLSLASLPG